MAQLKASGKLTAETCALCDVRGVTKMPTNDDLHHLHTGEHRWPRRRAYLVQPGYQYGVMRPLQSLAAEDMEIQVFTDEAAALEWVGARLGNSTRKSRALSRNARLSLGKPMTHATRVEYRRRSR